MRSCRGQADKAGLFLCGGDCRGIWLKPALPPFWAAAVREWRRFGGVPEIAREWAALPGSARATASLHEIRRPQDDSMRLGANPGNQQQQWVSR